MNPTTATVFKVRSALFTVRGWLSESLTQAPLILMALLALASFALFKQAPTDNQKKELEVASSRNDYFLHRFSATNFLPTGAAKSHLSGTRAEHNPVTKTLTISELAFIASSQSGIYQGTARAGTVSDDGKSITLSTGVVVDKKSASKNATSVNNQIHFESEHIDIQLDPDVLQAEGATRKPAATQEQGQIQEPRQGSGRVRITLEKR